MIRTTITLPVEVHLELEDIAHANRKENLIKGKRDKPDSISALVANVMGDFAKKKGGLKKK